MGQTWCREKSTKVQDSKSPLDRVFLRCAHRIYPGLKDDGSVLGGATQRVTSSEIGYASSPPRSALTRGHSIDSVDRPFHPSEWVDVNLEVPNTPRPDCTRTYLPANNVRSVSLTNVKDIMPIPPPRRRNKNKGRPLPPKPDEISRSEGELSEDPLYSSVKSNYTKDSAKGTKELYEYKVNGTGRTIPSDVVSRQSFDKRSLDVKSCCKVAGEDDRERLFSRRRSMQHGADMSSASQNFVKPDMAKRPKNCSTSSLPNYDELVGVKRHTEELCIVNKLRNNYSTGAIHTNEIERILRENTEVNGGIRRKDEDDNSISVVVDEARADFADSAEPPLKLESTMRTSTPMKDAIGDNSISTKKFDEWFRRQESSLSRLKESYFTAIQGDSTNTTEHDKSSQQMVKRTLSTESEPFDSFEEKELTLQLSSSSLVRAISEESLPQEMLEDVVDGLDNGDTDFFDAKSDTRQSSKSSTKTPPSTPESKIKADLTMNGGFKRKKLLEGSQDDAGSNLSSMTPSLTELEYALSDMLERKERDEERCEEKLNARDGSLEPKIVPLENDQNDETIHNVDARSQHLKNKRTSTSEIEIVGFNFKKKSSGQKQFVADDSPEESFVDPPEKPSRTHKMSLDDSAPENIPTPPRRRYRSSSSGAHKDNSGFNDRLI